MKLIFPEEQFTATQWSTAKEKAEFATWLIRFIEKGAPQSLFHKTKYRRLSNCFGHIAHYNVYGFYDEWFQHGTAEWIKYIITSDLWRSEVDVLRC